MTLTDPHKAIFGRKSNGPTFGGGCDLAIADKCNTNRSSYAHFATSYNYYGKYQRNQQSYNALVGATHEHNFRVIEYEVFQVII
jgi:hypothetical protein